MWSFCLPPRATLWMKERAHNGADQSDSIPHKRAAPPDQIDQ